MGKRFYQKYRSTHTKRRADRKAKDVVEQIEGKVFAKEVIIMPHPTGPTDPNVKALISRMKRKKERFYLVLARHLEKPKRSKRPVNVTKIGKFAGENEPVAVPGKVLGSGDIRKPVTVYALSFSKDAERKIAAAGGKCLPLAEVDKKARIII